MLPETTITLATSVPAGPSPLLPSTHLSPYCRVAGSIKPTADSDIKFELWMPEASHWNRNFEGVENGGFGGFINRDGMITALHAGFATASTDTGHAAGWMDAQWPPGIRRK